MIDDDCPQSVEQLIARAHQLSKQGVKLFVVDYIQLVNVGDVPAEMLRVAYGNAVRMLTEDAKNNDRCWIILTQLSRSADGRAPVLSDAKETSAIEENMHWILGLHRDTMNDGRLHPDELQCWILKIAMVQQGKWSGLKQVGRQTFSLRGYEDDTRKKRD